MKQNKTEIAIGRLNQAINKIILEGKKKGLFSYNFNESWDMAIGKRFYGDFVDIWLVECFQNTLEDFKKDCSNKEEYKLAILEISAKFTEASLHHALS